MKQNEYNKLEIPGIMLIPGFSIYLLEIIFDKKRLFYVGMTGDNFYPSARAAFHRISGHLELTQKSTQNQLLNALYENKINESNFDKLRIIMHSFPISGFKKWIGTKTLKASLIKEKITTKEYETYKKRQNQVRQFEDLLIYRIRKRITSMLLNKTSGNEAKLRKEFEDIYKTIFKIIDIKNVDM